MIEHIKPLPISEEMLGAYLEGNLSLEETRNVENMICNNDDLSALIAEVTGSEMDENLSIESDFLNWNEDFELPEIKTNDLSFNDEYESLGSFDELNSASWENMGNWCSSNEKDVLGFDEFDNLEYHNDYNISDNDYDNVIDNDTPQWEDWNEV